MGSSNGEILGISSLARWGDGMWSSMGRTDSTPWTTRNGVKPVAVSRISLSSQNWCWDRSGGSSMVEDGKGLLEVEIV